MEWQKDYHRHLSASRGSISVVVEERAAMDNLPSYWPRLITLVGAPLEDVVESSETSDKGGIHLMKELVQGQPRIE